MRWGARLAVRLVAALVVLAVVVVGGTAVRVWQVGRSDSRPTSDALLVLGTAQFDGRPSEIFTARLRHAQSLYRAGVAPVIVTVGGKRPGDRFSEAAAGRRFLIDAGVPADDVVAVESGSDTVQSLQDAAHVFDERGWTSVVLVTDPYHSLRTRAVARDEGLDAETSPTRQGPVVQTRSTQLRYIVRETGAYLYYRLYGRGPDGDVPSAV